MWLWVLPRPPLNDAFGRNDSVATNDTHWSFCRNLNPNDTCSLHQQLLSSGHCNTEDMHSVSFSTPVRISHQPHAFPPHTQHGSPKKCSAFSFLCQLEYIGSPRASVLGEGGSHGSVLLPGPTTLLPFRSGIGHRRLLRRTLRRTVFWKIKYMYSSNIHD